jgi:hypothetical protein
MQVRAGKRARRLNATLGGNEKMTEYTFRYSTRGKLSIVMVVFCILLTAIGLGIGLSGKELNIFGLLFALFAFAGLCNIVYRSIHPLEWNINITDGDILWESSKWPSSRSKLNIREIVQMDIWWSEGKDTVRLSMSDGRTAAIPANCLGDLPGLKKALQTQNPQLKVQEHQGTPNQAL